MQKIPTLQLLFNCTTYIYMGLIMSMCINMYITIRPVPVPPPSTISGAKRQGIYMWWGEERERRKERKLLPDAAALL